MNDHSGACAAQSLLRLQSWLSPAFPTGAYSYSHGLERAIEIGHVHDVRSLVEWLQMELCYGSVRNEAILFSEAWRAARSGDVAGLLGIAELAAAFRGTSEFALESSQQAASALGVLRVVWPEPMLEWLAHSLAERALPAALAVVLGARTAKEGMPATLALPAFLQGYTSNLVTSAVRLIPLGQTAAQLVIAELEEAVLSASARAENQTLEDLGSAAFAVDLVSMEHETQYTRLFRS